MASVLYGFVRPHAAVGEDVSVGELRLRAVRPALAEETARADADLRLQDVEAGAERVAVGMEPRIEAGALVVVAEELTPLPLLLATPPAKS